MMLILFKRCGLMASAHRAVSRELSMRDELRPGLDGPGRMVKSRGLDGKFSYLTKIWGFAKLCKRSIPAAGPTSPSSPGTIFAHPNTRNYGF